MRIILASTSIYRSKALKKIGVCFEVVPSSFNEKKIRCKRPSSLTKRLSFEKARDVCEKLKKVGEKKLVVIGGDSVGYYKGKILEKPKNKEEAFKMLMMLSGKKHYFYSGVTILKIENEKESVFSTYDKNGVYFRKLSEDEVRVFVKKEPVEIWAGSYNLEVDEKKGYGFIRKVTGDRYNVWGIPIGKIRNMILA